MAKIHPEAQGLLFGGNGSPRTTLAECRGLYITACASSSPGFFLRKGEAGDMVFYFLDCRFRGSDTLWILLLSGESHTGQEGHSPFPGLLRRTTSAAWGKRTSPIRLKYSSYGFGWGISQSMESFQRPSSRTMVT
jgi:hypothetical protein